MLTDYLAFLVGCSSLFVLVISLVFGFACVRLILWSVREVLK